MTPTTRSPSAAEVTPVGLRLTKFRDPLHIPPVLRPSHTELLTICMRTVHARLHSELPPTRLWAYDGRFPGPTIEVRRAAVAGGLAERDHR